MLGCGAVGLATARLLQESGFKVTIYTKALPPDTTSNAAGGAWTPFLVADPEKMDARFSQQLLSAAKFAHERYLAMLGEQFGVRWIRSYAISKGGFDESSAIGEQSMFRSMRPEFRDLTPAEHPFPADSAVRQFDTLLIEPPRYLQAMMDAFRQASGTILVRAVPDRAAIARLPEKLVFNCTGLGAKELFDDGELTPARGQLTFPQATAGSALCRVTRRAIYAAPVRWNCAWRNLRTRSYIPGTGHGQNAQNSGAAQGVLRQLQANQLLSRRLQ